MYVPAHFREERVPVLHDAIRAIGFGTLVTWGAEGLEANHVPMLVEPEPAPFGTLRGHLARGNPQWQRAAPGVAALATFVEPDAYVSPSWYATKRETGKAVPTWNYIAVHAYGALEIVTEPARLREHVGRLTATHEAGRAEPWGLGDAPADYIEGMLKGIVGFALAIARLEGKWKLSQNRPERDIVGVREGLAAEGGEAQRAVADAMGAGRP
jgi:transcriptional regulator